MSAAHPEREEQKLRYFKDPECTQPMYAIRFPEPVVRGEEQAELVVYAKNITDEELDLLKFEPKDPDLTITPDVNRVEPKGTIRVVFIFAPSENRNKRLDSEFKVSGRAIIKGIT